MKGFYKKISTLLLLIFVSYSAYTQRSSGLMIDGTVLVEEGSPDNVIIEMTEDGKRAPDYDSYNFV